MNSPYIVQHTEPINWVKRRAECQPRAIFGALRAQVEADVGEANKLDTCARLEIIDDGAPCFSVQVVGENRPFGSAVRFERSAASIAVECKDAAESFAITWVWDDDAVACRLMVAGAEADLWRISQKALSRLVFG